MFSAATISSKVDPLSVGVLTVVQGQSAYDSVRRGSRANSYGGILNTPTFFTGLSGRLVKAHELAASQGTPSQIIFTIRKDNSATNYSSVVQEWNRLIFNGQVFTYADLASKSRTTFDQLGFLSSSIEWAGMPYSASSPFPTIQFIIE